METSFPRTLRALSGERSPWALVASLVATLLFLGWGVWMARARVRLHAVTATARLEAGGVARPVAALRSGRIAAARAVLGDAVHAGDVLFELDADAARLALAEARAGLPALGERRAALERAAAAEEQRARTLAAVAAAELDELDAWIRAGEAAAGTARDGAERSAELQAQGLVADADAERLAGEAEGAESRSQALRHRRERRRMELDDRLQEARARLEGLRADRAELDGTEALLRASAERLERDLAECSVRAPVDGRVGALSDLRPGAVVQAGQELAVVVPDRALAVLADMPVAEAAGRIAPGQPARMRLDGFPWSQHGSLMLRVVAVAAEPRGERLRVELAIPDPGAFPVPLRHGMTGAVEVVVEEVTPLGLLLRSVGRWIDGPRAEAGAGARP